MRVNFTVNGRPQEADDVWEGESLLYVLRERMGLPGSKNACEQGECGSCTVRLDGIPVCSCLVAAGQAEGREVVTVEGLADYAKQRAEHARELRNGRLRHLRRRGQGLDGETARLADRRGHPTRPDPAGVHRRRRRPVRLLHPGLLVAADEMLEHNPTPTDADIREALSGNLCRCTGYEKIMDAVRLAAARQGEAV